MKYRKKPVEIEADQMTMLTDDINGLHVVLECDHPASVATLMIRTRYCSTGKVALIIRDGRKVTDFTVDAADLIEAVAKLVPAAAK